MNIFKRILLLLLISVLLLPSLTSCLLVEDLQAKRADWADETRTDIVFDGQTYKPLLDLPLDAELYLDSQPRCYVVDKDVPLLLLDTVGDALYHDPDKKYLRFNGNYYHKNDWDRPIVYYCRADLFEEMSERVKTIAFDRFYTIIHKEIVDISGTSFVRQQLILSEEQSAAMKAVLETEQETGELLAFKNAKDTLVSFHLYPCSEDGLFTKEEYILFYYDTATDRYFLTSDNKYHLVPASQNDIFRAIAEWYEQMLAPGQERGTAVQLAD